MYFRFCAPTVPNLLNSLPPLRTTNNVMLCNINYNRLTYAAKSMPGIKKYNKFVGVMNKFCRTILVPFDVL